MALNFNKKQLSRNYTKKELEKAISKINVQFKGKSTYRDHLTRSLITSDTYDDLRDLINLNEQKQTTPKGLKISKILDEEILVKSLYEVMNIIKDISATVGENDDLTNYRFYINTPYFDRTGNNDPFPLYRWDDHRVSALCQIVEIALKSFNQSYSDLLNVIVRIYRPGDILNFHTDRDNFTDSVYGIILENNDPSRGLILSKNKNKPYMLMEQSGTIWELSDEARWEWEHGYCTNFKLDKTRTPIIRISITFRFFKNKKVIPGKQYVI